MKIADIVALAKAGYSPKQVKELLEMVETSPAVKEATVDEVINKETATETKKPEEVSKDEVKDAVQTLIDILKEE